MLYQFDPNYAVHPGATVREYQEYSGMSQQEFATRLCMTVQNLAKITGERGPITPETASALEKVTGTPASFWNKLQSQYNEYCVREKIAREAENQAAWVKRFPVKEMVERGFLQANENIHSLYESLLEFFGVVNPKAWDDLWMCPEAAPRRAQAFEDSPYIAATWLRMGEKIAMQTRLENGTDKNKFKKILPDILKLSCNEPRIFIPQMWAMCADVGVYFVLVPELKKLTWHGVTKWLHSRNAMILLNLREKKEDTFWFSFMHEACHVLYDSKKDLLINVGDKENESEQRANAFAAKLICNGLEAEIKKARSAQVLKEIATQLGVAPGLVAGQHRFMTNNFSQYNNLIRTLSWLPSEGYV